MGRKYKDNALTTLASSITGVSTTLTVATGKGDNFPAVTGAGTPGATPSYFVITLEDASGNREKVRVEHRAAASDVLGSAGFPLVRGYDGTVALAFNAGDSVDLRLERAGVQDVEDSKEASKGSQLFGEDGATTTGLTWGYKGGNLPVAGGVTPIAASTVVLTNAATNYVEATPAGAVSVNTSGFTAGRIRIREITTAGSQITASTDRRSVLMQWCAAIITGLTLSYGTITASDPATFSQTWNNAGVTFVAKSNDITDTASNAASILERWRVGGSDKFSIDKSGNIVAAGNATIGTGSGARALIINAGGGASEPAAVIFQYGGAQAAIVGLSGRVQGDTSSHAALFADTGRDILLYTNGSSTDKARLTSGGIFLIGDTSNAFMTIGVTVNQGGNDNDIVALKSSDVAHGMTSIQETDTFGRAIKWSATNGGLQIDGYSAGTVGLSLQGRHTTDDTAKTTGARGALVFSGTLKSGTTVTALGANANILAILSDSTTRFILDSDGDSHQDVGTAWTNFDDHDDIALLTAVAYNVARHDDPILRKFGQWMTEKRPEIEKAGIVTFNADGHHFVNWSRHSMALNGAIRQLGERFDDHDKRLTELTAENVALKSQLHILEVRNA